MSQQETKNIISRPIIQFTVLLLIITFISILAYTEYAKTLQKTTHELNTKIIHLHTETFSKLSHVYEKDSKCHFLQSVTTNAKLRHNFEDMLRLIRISTIQNLFVITKDEDGNYYFLLDSDNNLTTRANIFEPFSPLGNFWDEAYKQKKVEVFHHKQGTNLWITIAYPIVENNQTVALIGADISHNLDLIMQTRLQSFNRFFLWLVIIGLLTFVAHYILTLYFRKKYYEGYRDPLTNVYNRKYLYDILIKKLSRRYQLFMVDIDHFKKVNDTYGHDAGDVILQEVAKRLKSLTRNEDSIIRYGGEEFVIYTTKLNAQQSKAFAERLREHVKKEPIYYKNIECRITVSIGVNPYARNEKPFDEMLKKADEALYRAKMSGRDRVYLSE
ncbi:sensor domain-containing diguanylate cyclase [Sulfurimonas paralvinellae]|uniref:diguanylate cyclase n=1 Tax=Sulfurimonas paralvinellae TaxID=317658 RepID=A0A7M1BAM8_9BACT|nr:diguanylate cyclase [Sulfurimonas paralvinellae]QOP46476.1 diguanylate cyclase [Sulfurimonas paralvinellae]